MSTHCVFSTPVTTPTYCCWWSEYTAANVPLAESCQRRLLVQKCTLWLPQQYHIDVFPLSRFLLGLDCSSTGFLTMPEKISILSGTKPAIQPIWLQSSKPASSPHCLWIMKASTCKIFNCHKWEKMNSLSYWYRCRLLSLQNENIMYSDWI